MSELDRANSVHTWTESALIISPLSFLASSSASRLFPAPVGPDITMTFSFFGFAEAEHWKVLNSRLRQHLRRWTRKERAEGEKRGYNTDRC